MEVGGEVYDGIYEILAHRPPRRGAKWEPGAPFLRESRL